MLSLLLNSINITEFRLYYQLFICYYFSIGLMEDIKTIIYSSA